MADNLIGIMVAVSIQEAASTLNRPELLNPIVELFGIQEVTRERSQSTLQATSITLPTPRNLVANTLINRLPCAAIP